MTDAVIFDLDGLLINSEPYWQQAELEILCPLGVPLTLDMIHQTVGLRCDLVVAHWYQRYPWQGKTPEQVTQEIIAYVVDQVKSHGQLQPGALHAIALAKDEVGKLAIATSSPSIMAQTVIEKFDIQAFDAVESADELPYAKPHPQVYLNAANALGADPLKCVALEDSLTGMTAAKAARMKTIVVPEHAKPGFALADITLNSLSELSAKDLQS